LYTKGFENSSGYKEPKRSNVPTRKLWRARNVGI